MRWPAEWEKHQATWICWPCRSEIWTDQAEIESVFIEIINHISEFENVNLLITSAHISRAKRGLNSAINFIEIAIDDSWARDTMPLFVEANARIQAVDWDFNCWGEKFTPYDKDAELGKNLARKFNWNLVHPGMVLEGGSVHTNGKGLFLTTKECLLNPNRNPKLNVEAIEMQLKKHMGMEKIIWLPYGVAGDVDTDGHIDNIACFVNENTICMQVCDDPNDENYARVKANRETLSKCDLHIIEIPQPKASFYQNERLPLSYLNFYFCNNAIILPKFGQKKEDENARRILQEFFPMRKIVSINIMPLVMGGGGIHCITMQQPVGVVK